MLNQFIPLDPPVPPDFAETLGYADEGRYVAFYWIPAGDELMYDDGQISGTGDYAPWLLWTRHITVAVALFGFDFGSSDDEAQHWLLLDRQERRIYAGEADDIAQFLYSQLAAVELRAAWEALSPEDRQRVQTEALKQLHQALSDSPIPNREDLECQRQELRRRYRKLGLWLDQQPVICPACSHTVPAALWNASNHTCPSCGELYWTALLTSK